MIGQQATTPTDGRPMALRVNATARWREELAGTVVRSWVEDPSQPVPVMQRHQCLLATASVGVDASRGHTTAICRAASQYRTRGRYGRYVDTGNGVRRFLEDPTQANGVEVRGGAFRDEWVVAMANEIADAYGKLGPDDAFVHADFGDHDRLVGGIMAVFRLGLGIMFEQAGGTVMVTLWEWNGPRRKTVRQGTADRDQNGVVTVETVARAFEETNWRNLATG